MDGITTSINAILKNLIKNFNTLLDCPVRFSGEYDRQKVHNFIEYIECYKKVKCIGDEQALQELQYLLQNQAHSWWLRRKSNIDTWSEALTIIEMQFSHKRPAHVVYNEVLKHNYKDYESAADFIDDKLELFSEMSQLELKDENKLQIIYALLPNEVQNKFKIMTITDINDLKEKIKLVELDKLENPSNNENVLTNTLTEATEENIESSVQNLDNTNKEPHVQNNTIQIDPKITESVIDTEREPRIKVRRTEDLMTQDIKEEIETQTDQEEFIANDTVLASTNNNILQPNEHDFQIDNDIMNQINNIIDESEMNMNVLNNTLNNNQASVMPNSSNVIESVELLGFNIEVIQSEKLTNKSEDNQSKTKLNVTKKIKPRCSYCRKCNHTSDVCFKKSRNMKELPEMFVSPKTRDGNVSIDTKNNDKPTENLPFNVSTANSNIINTTNSVVSTETATAVAPVIPNPIPTTSILYTSLITTPSVVTSAPIVVSNTVSEKINNPSLTTKLIAPINGKTSSKILASKLRSLSTPSPKCHQCGTVGFYKSICPNCSPIYNNGNNHNQYGK